MADTAAQLPAAPQVADGWHRPSALAKLSVRGPAGHLAGQVFLVPAMPAEPVPSEPAISIHEYYGRASWIGSDLDTPFNQGIRSSGEDQAADGPAALASRVAACVEELRGILPGAPDRRVRRPGWGGRGAFGAAQCPQDLRHAVPPQRDPRQQVHHRLDGRGGELERLRSDILEGRPVGTRRRHGQ